MTSVAFSALSTDTSLATASKPTARPVVSPADEKFWQSVFDHAHGSGVDMHADEGGADHQDARAFDAAMPIAVGSGSMVDAEVGLNHALTNGAPHERPNVMLNTMTGRASPFQSPMTWQSVQFVTPTEHASAGICDTRDVDAHDKVPASALHQDHTSPEVEAAIRAHVMQTADGDWKVSLRASKGVSVAQALAAVAQAIQHEAMPNGDVAQVTLNGTCIYQQANPSGSSASASPVFELKC